MLLKKCSKYFYLWLLCLKKGVESIIKVEPIERKTCPENIHEKEQEKNLFF